MALRSACFVNVPSLSPHTREEALWSPSVHHVLILRGFWAALFSRMGAMHACMCVCGHVSMTIACAVNGSGNVVDGALHCKWNLVFEPFLDPC